MPTGKRTDPYRSFNFRLEIDGLTAGSFSGCSGLSSDGDVVPYREGTDIPLTVRQLMGMRKHGPIKLERGVTPNTELWDWYTNIMNGIADRRNVSIILMDEQRKDVKCWIAVNAWPNKVTVVSDLKASGNEVAMESVEIVHESLTLEKP